MPWPSCGLSRSQMRDSHLAETDPGHPGMIKRTGKPWIGSRGLPYIPHDEVALVHQLLDRHPARQGALGGVARQMRVGAVMTAEHGGGFQPCGTDHVGQPRPRPLSIAGAAVGPLIAARLRDEKGSA